MRFRGERERGKEIGREEERGRERGWSNALRSNGCLETVVKETLSPWVLWHLKCPIFMLIFRKTRLFGFLCFPLSSQQVNIRQKAMSTQIRRAPQTKEAWIICSAAQTRGNDTLRILLYLNRSDNCQIIAHIWQLHTSPEEIERETWTIWVSFFLWHPISLSNRDRKPPSLCLSVADSLSGHLLIFSQKNTSRERGKSHLLRASRQRLSN